MLVRIASREDLDQIDFKSSEAVGSGPALFVCLMNFRTFTT